MFVSLEPRAIAVNRFSSLPRHRELESLLGADHVVDVLGRSVDVDLHPVDLAAELVAARTVVRRHGLTNVTAHFRGLVHGEEERMRAPDLPFANRLAVDEQHDSRALADAAPVVRELHAYLVRRSHRCASPSPSDRPETPASSA